MGITVNAVRWGGLLGTSGVQIRLYCFFFFLNLKKWPGDNLLKATKSVLCFDISVVTRMQILNGRKSRSGSENGNHYLHRGHASLSCLHSAKKWPLIPIREPKLQLNMVAAFPQQELQKKNHSVQIQHYVDATPQKPFPLAGSESAWLVMNLLQLLRAN